MPKQRRFAVLERMLVPALATATASGTPTPGAALAGAPATGGAGVPSCASESGSNY